jgi:Family of unknown function (DUF5681)
MTDDPGMDRAFDLSEGVGYRRPPVHTRFQPGKSGNPSGRPKGGKNLKTLFNKILNEQISLREGATIRQISKAEALLRGVVISALKGEQRSLATLFRIAEQAGHFEDPQPTINSITRIIVSTGVPRNDDPIPLPANSELNRDQG